MGLIVGFNLEQRKTVALRVLHDRLVPVRVLKDLRPLNALSGFAKAATIVSTSLLLSGCTQTAHSGGILSSIAEKGFLGVCAYASTFIIKLSMRLPSGVTGKIISGLATTGAFCAGEYFAEKALSFNSMTPWLYRSIWFGVEFLIGAYYADGPSGGGGDNSSGESSHTPSWTPSWNSWTYGYDPKNDD